MAVLEKRRLSQEQRKNKRGGGVGVGIGGRVIRVGVTIT